MRIDNLNGSRSHCNVANWVGRGRPACFLDKMRAARMNATEVHGNAALYERLRDANLGICRQHAAYSPVFVLWYEALLDQPLRSSPHRKQTTASTTLAALLAFLGVMPQPLTTSPATFKVVSGKS